MPPAKPAADNGMRHLRFNIANTLIAVLFVAVGFAALRDADELWDSWLFSLALGFLMLAVLLAVHRNGGRRGFWIGFALFGWGYLSLSSIQSTEPRLITTKALAYLHQANILGSRAYEMRAILSLDRMRAYNLSEDDVRMSLRESGMTGPPAELGGWMVQKSMTVVEHVLTWRARYNKPEKYANHIILATSDGELVRLKDVAKVEMGTSSFIPGVWAGTAETFVRIGHSLVALLAAWLGGELSRQLGRVSVAPEVPSQERSIG